MRLPRLTTRRLMVLVAVVAVVLFTVHLRRLSVVYEKRASQHAAEERRYRNREARWADQATAGLVAPIHVELARIMAEIHGAKRQAYERAARYPWLRVPSDPPPSK